MNKTLVVGASGTVGRLLVKELQDRGHDIVTTTSKAAQGASQRHLNLITGEGLAQAFEGVARAFLLSPAGPTNQDELLKPLVDMACERKLQKVVMMTAIGVDADDHAPLRKAERHLEQSGLRYNIIRPNWFMQNFNTFWLDGIVKAQTIALPVGQARTSFVDARDIAATAAALLDGDAFDNQAFVLTGSDSLTHDEAAAILSEVTRTTIRFRDITPEQNRAQLLAAGMPPTYVELLVLLLGVVKAGYVAAPTDAVARITGRAPRTFAHYANDYRQAWS